MKKLTIGEMECLLGIPPSAMRFYETKDILAPEKDALNSYRAYGADDSCRLLLAKRYQSLGFSLGRTTKLLDEADEAILESALEERRRELEAEAARIAETRRRLDDYAADRRAALRLAGRFEPGSLGPRRYLFTRDNGEYLREPERAALAREWMALLPTLEYVCVVPEDAFLGEAPPRSRWGFALPADAAVPGGPWAESVGACGSLATGFARTRTRDFTREELEPLAELFRAQGRAMAGPAVASFLGYDRSGGSARLLYRLDIPVKI